jgi:hypothetical protein
VLCASRQEERGGEYRSNDVVHKLTLVATRFSGKHRKQRERWRCAFVVILKVRTAEGKACETILRSISAKTQFAAPDDIL